MSLVMHVCKHALRRARLAGRLEKQEGLSINHNHLPTRFAVNERTPVTVPGLATVYSRVRLRGGQSVPLTGRISLTRG